MKADFVSSAFLKRDDLFMYLYLMNSEFANVYLCSFEGVE